MASIRRLFNASSKPGKGDRGGKDPDYRKAYHRLLRLQETMKAITSERSLKSLLGRIMDSVIEITEAERGFLILSKDGKADIATARNIDREEVRRPDFKISHSIAEKVLTTGEPIVARNAIDETAFSVYSSVTSLRLKSVLCLPFRLHGSIIGALYIDHRFEEGKFGPDDLAVLETFADQASIAIDNARLNEENERTQHELESLNRLLTRQVAEKEQELAAALEARADQGPESALSPLAHDYSRIIGKSAALRRVLEVLDRITDTDLPVLILGESGTGKELVAQVLHKNGPRATGPFIAENCAAIPETLMESELFGATKGAFTGADRDRIGLFEQAHHGTLFLDEVGELRTEVQGKLLRVLEEREIRRLGGTSLIPVDVRLIAASNRPLEEDVRSGRFRQDLYYRLKGVAVTVPPLRDRREDIPLLVEHELELIARRESEKSGSGTDAPPPTRPRPKKVVREVLRKLLEHSWPGNVRELINEVRRLAALSEGDIEDPALVGRLEPGPAPAGQPWWDGRSLRDIEREAIRRVLEQCDGKRAEAARRLGIPRRTLFDKLRRYGLDGN